MRTVTKRRKQHRSSQNVRAWNDEGGTRGRTHNGMYRETSDACEIITLRRKSEAERMQEQQSNTSRTIEAATPGIMEREPSWNENDKGEEHEGLDVDENMKRKKTTKATRTVNPTRPKGRESVK
ncbi:hypothetical protein R1flu_028484 [Riccia fluitans]|uniref:Uncharacterized protein n=1 Tax=Riccia fluitans TaxID=41844 RepID=A0ABD1XPT0_9MARC